MVFIFDKRTETHLRFICLECNTAFEVQKDDPKPLDYHHNDKEKENRENA